MKKVYIAGAYTSDTSIRVFSSIREGMLWSALFMLKGCVAFNPWLNYQFQLMIQDNQSLTIDGCFSYSMDLLRDCDAVFVIPSFEETERAFTSAEIVEADRLGIPVYFNIDEI